MPLVRVLVVSVAATHRSRRSDFLYSVVISLPAEGMDYHGTHDLTPSGFSGTPSEVTIDAGGSAVEYFQTGNTYNIAYTVTYKDGDIASYDISIKGSVYGDVEHTCTK
ncbi:MAG: hypothetical protein ACE5JF_06780 [Anaerolineales bacterium]